MSHCASHPRCRPRKPHCEMPRAESHSDEALLVEYAANGNPQAFDELVHRYERELFSYLRKYLRSAQLAEDAFQAAFLQVHLNCRDFDPQRRFRPWLYRIATTRAIDLLRKNRRWSEIGLGAAANNGLPGEDGRPIEDMSDPRLPDPERQLEAAEEGEQLRAVVEQLPKRLKDVVALITFQGYAYQQAADRLGIPLGSVKSRMAEAIAQMRKTYAAAARAA